MIRKYDKRNKFVSLFNPDTGFYARTGIIGEDGRDTGVDPFMTSYPELIDVGIMQTCVCAKHCNVDCYQKAIDRVGKNMSVENFRKILEESKGKTFQCLHENEVVLRKCGEYLQSIYIKDIKVGDEIFCGNNTFHNVSEKYEKLDDVYEITLNYGKKILATSDHRFMTVNGLKKVNELVLGDELLSANGRYNVDPINKLDVVKMLIACGMDDKFYLSDCDGMSKVCKENNILRNTSKTVLISNIKDHLDEIDYSNALISRERSQFRFNAIYFVTKDLMKLLGHYVGNGSSRRYVINKEQTGMINTIKEALHNVFPNFIYSMRDENNACIIELNSRMLHKELFDTVFGCRLNGEKQLPNFIFNVSDDMKIAFLEGYFCDGNMKICDTDGKYGSIVFNTSSEKLYKDMTMLLSSLGVDYSIHIYDGGQEPFSKTDRRIINRRTRYRISIGNLLEIQKIHTCVSEHKDADSFNSVVMSDHDPKYLKKRKGYNIKSIRKIDGKRRVIDININSEDHLFITTHGIVSHNCAIGGAGDPDTHENFEEILRLCKEYGIVPNFTTSGIAMTKEKAEICKKFCGAVAVSMHHAPYTYKAIQLLLDAGVKTNIHYVLGQNSIADATRRLKDNDFPKGINAVVFLLYKPVGLGKNENVLRNDDPRVEEFFKVIDTGDFDFKIGFDSCTIPGLLNYTKNVNPDSFDTCEGGRWSMYITADMKALPCSFDNQDLRWAYDISNDTIQNAWDSEVFEDFRNHFKNSCPNCNRRRECMGGCPIRNEIVLCDNKRI